MSISINPDEQLPVNSRARRLHHFSSARLSNNTVRALVRTSAGIPGRMSSLIEAVFQAGALETSQLSTASSQSLQFSDTYFGLGPFPPGLSPSCCVKLCVIVRLRVPPPSPPRVPIIAEVSGGQPRRRNHSPPPNNGRMYPD